MVSPSALLTLVVAAGSAVHVAPLSSAPSNEFVEVRPQLWRYNGEFAFIPSPAQRTPVAVWLVEAKSSWILIDTGAASPVYKDPFLAALKRKLSFLSSPLRLILRELGSHPCPDHSASGLPAHGQHAVHRLYCLAISAVATKSFAAACSDAWSPRPCWTVAVGA